MSSIDFKVPKPNKLDLDKLPAKFRNRLLEAIKEQRRSIRKHFKEDGWDLSFDGILDDVFYDTFGFHLSDYVLSDILNAVKGIGLNLGKNGIVFTGGGEPVYFDMWENKIVMPGKDYNVLDYRELDGFMMLGYT